MVGVIPYSAFIHGMIDVRYFIILLMLLTVMVLVALNRVVSARISSPILKLNASVLEYEAGEKPEVLAFSASLAPLEQPDMRTSRHAMRIANSFFIVTS